VQIDFLEEGSEDCPLIRLYGVEPGQFATLHATILRLATGAREECSLHEVPGLCALSGSRLKLISSSADEGVRRIGQDLDFEWRLRQAQWFSVAGLVEFFAQGGISGSYHGFPANKHDMDSISAKSLYCSPARSMAGGDLDTFPAAP
jgi:hypothetical protein